jgi:hypothetical protein
LQQAYAIAAKHPLAAMTPAGKDLLDHHTKLAATAAEIRQRAEALGLDITGRTSEKTE